jgi:hypothetical protein
LFGFFLLIINYQFNKIKFMKKNYKIAIVLCFVFILGVAGIVLASSPSVSPSLGTASSFSILAKTPITNIPTSSISGDIGLDNAGSNYAGLTSVEVTGTIFDTNGTGPDAGLGNNATLMTSARAANNTAFLALSAAPNAACGDATILGDDGTTGGSGTADGIDWTGTGPIDLSGKTLAPGIYCADSYIMTTGTALTLNGTLASDVWIFRAATTLDTTDAVGANIVFTPGAASACNVWWKVGSSATIGVNTDFIGNILALTSISMDTGATLIGRLLAYNGAVTLDSNTISGCAVANVNPSLTLNKIISGGSSSESDWTLTATGPMTLSGPGAAGSADVAGSVAVGTYDLSESTGPSRYNASSWSCVKNSGPAVSGSSIALTWNDVAFCSITNTYHPHTSGGSYSPSPSYTVPVVSSTSPVIHVTKVASPTALFAGSGLVTYTEKISNPGSSTLSNITIADDKCAPMKFVSGDTNNNSKLETTETWTYICQARLTRTTTNTVSVTGEANSSVARDSAVATVVVSVPGLPKTGLPNNNSFIIIISVCAFGLISAVVLTNLKKRKI